MTHGVHVVLQMTLPIVGEDDAAQFAVSSKVETSIGGEHEQTSHVPPADVFLWRLREKQLKIQKKTQHLPMVEDNH